MYQVLIDGNVLFDTRFDDYKLTNAKLNLQVNKAGNFTFSIYPSNPSYDNIQKLKSHIEVYQDNVLIFGGRVLNDTVRFDNRKDVICEGYLAYFNDSVIRPYSFNGTITEYLTLMLNEHNAQVDSNKQFTLGNVTVTDPNNFIVRSNINYTKSWQEINDKLLDLLGGFLVVRVENDIKYLDYLEDSIYMSGQSIELGKNLLDAIQERRSDEIVTALIPLGAKLQDENGNDTDVRLTVESVNGGLDYIHDTDAVSEYGWVFDTKIWDDVTDPNNLLTKANQELAVRINLGVSVELKAIDLSMVKEPELWGTNLFRGIPLNDDYVATTNNYFFVDYNSLGRKIRIEPNETYTFSCDFEILSSNLTTDMRISIGYGTQSSNFVQDRINIFFNGTVGAKGKIIDTFVMPASKTVGRDFFGFRFSRRGTLHTSQVAYKNIKLEKGNIAHKWTPAPEDVPSIDEIRVFEYVQVTSEPHDIDTMALITKMEIDLLNPQNNAFTFGFNYATFTEKQVKSEQAIRNIENNYTTNQQLTNAINAIELKPGPPTYTWIRYADDINGGGISNDPTGKGYIGFAYNKLSATESNTPSDYTWSLIKGDKGDTGVKGDTGANGQTFYTWIKYSDNSDGTGLYDVPTANTQYIGIAVNKTTTTESTNKADYTWSKFKGDTGPQGATGTQGPKGDTGTSVVSAVEYYLATNLSSGVTTSTAGWTTTMQSMTTTNKYLWNYETINFSDGSSSPTIPIIIGVYGNTGATGRALTSVTEYYLASASASGVTRATSGWTTSMQTTSPALPYLWNYEKLTWSVAPIETFIEPIIIGVHGAQGPQGVQGPKGDNGTSQYVHIRYSANANGNPMTTSPQSTTKYIGLANTTSPTAPTGYTSYTWTLIKGTDGVDGIQGPPGADGNLNFTWVKYADSVLGEGMSDYPDGKMYIGLAFNKTTSSESSVPSDYQWSAMYDLQALNDVETRLSSNIDQTAEKIRIEVTEEFMSKNELNQYKNQVSTQFSQTATDYTFLFTQLEQYVQTLDGDTQAQFNEIIKYIRFIDGNIELGEVNNPIKLILQNDRISFTQNGAEVAYITDNTLYITDGRFLNSLRIGSFAYTPRSNGSLSFGKVV